MSFSCGLKTDGQERLEPITQGQETDRHTRKGSSFREQLTAFAQMGARSSEMLKTGPGANLLYSPNTWAV